MEKSIIDNLKNVEIELDDVLVKMRENDSKEMSMLLYSKAYLLSKKYSTINREFDIKLNSFLEESKDIKKKAIILILLNLIVFFMNLNLGYIILISGMCIAYNAYYIFDMLKNKNSIDETIRFIQNSIPRITLKMEECKNIIQKYISSNKIKSVEVEDYEFCVDMIMNYVYNSNYKINDLSENAKKLIINILKNDLETDENDFNKLLNMYREKVLDCSSILKLQLNKK